MGDIFQTKYLVDDRYVVIPDGKLKLFKNGKFHRALDVSAQDIFLCREGIFVAGAGIYDYEGNMVSSFKDKKIMGQTVAVLNDCNFMTQSPEGAFKAYSPKGELRGPDSAGPRSWGQIKSLA